MMRDVKIYGFTLLSSLMVLGCGDTGESGAMVMETDGDSSGNKKNKKKNSDDGGEGSGSTSVGGDDVGDTTGGTTGDPYEQPDVCIPGIPQTSQIPRMKNVQFDAAVRDLLGVTEVDGLPPSQVGPLADDFEGNMTQIAWNGYRVTADKVAAAVMAGPARANFIACDPAVAGCLEQTIRSFGRRAFRRPVTDAEVASFMRLTTEVDPVGTPEEHAEAILYAFLQSPSFLLIPELTAAQTENGAIKLSSYEVAARLSFLLWNSVPDETLNAAADADALQTQEQILAQAQRMVAERDKSGPMIAALHRHYAVVTPGSHWGKRDHDETLFPAYTPEVNEVMMQELDAFFEEVAFEGGTFSDLFLSNVAYVNNVTAPIYGLDPAAFGAELQRVELDPVQRPGFLSRIGFLSSFSHEASTSPALRGAYVSQQIIGTTVAPPPPGAADASVEGTFLTEREYINALTSPSECAGCHLTIINPPGYVLENYDSVGGWQEIDPRGGPINATADVLFADGPRTITSPYELMEELALNDGTREKYVEEVVEFATGRLPNSNDRCVVDDLAVKLADGYTLLDVVIDLTQTDSFRLRTAEE